MKIESSELILQINCLRDTLIEHKYIFEPHDDLPDYSLDIINTITLRYLEIYLISQPKTKE